jgi:type IV pilus assembly protein PilC
MRNASVFGIRRKYLIWLCGTLRTMVDAGLPMSRALDVLAGQAPGAMGEVLARVRRRVDEGASLAEAFEAEGRFPPLFLQLLDAGERSGTLELALAELARFYEFQRDQWHRFLARIAFPVLQYCAAVLVISATIYILSMIQGDPHGLVTGLLLGYGIPVALILLYRTVVKRLGATRLCHEAILRVPILGQVTQRLAVMRFSFVMYLMYEAGIPITEALERSLAATDNGAFAARAQTAVETIQRAGTLTEALRSTGLFPGEYLDIIAVAEESGKVSERLDWLSSHYAEKAESAMSMLATTIAVLIWLSVAVVIVFFIFTFFMRYIGGIYSQMG